MQNKLNKLGYKTKEQFEPINDQEVLDFFDSLVLPNPKLYTPYFKFCSKIIDYSDEETQEVLFTTRIPTVFLITIENKTQQIADSAFYTSRLVFRTPEDIRAFNELWSDFESDCNELEAEIEVSSVPKRFDA